MEPNSLKRSRARPTSTTKSTKKSLGSQEVPEPVRLGTLNLKAGAIYQCTLAARQELFVNVPRSEVKAGDILRLSKAAGALSCAKLDQHTSSALLPLLVESCIQVRVWTAGAPQTVQTLDEFEISMEVTLEAKAFELTRSLEKSHSQRLAFIEFFKYFDSRVTQKSLMKQLEDSASNTTTETNVLEELENAQLPAVQPASSFTTDLYEYQQQGLAWMLRIEQEEAKDELHHMWAEYAFQRNVYFNPFTGQVSLEFPRSSALCRGGILADEMGLGKTVQLIALIHSHKPSRRSSVGKKRVKYEYGNTLIVVPLSVLTQWKREILTHGRGLIVVDFHSKKPLEQLKEADVVLTTYGVISNTPPELLKIRWFRIILDEGHMIKNQKTACAKACYALKGEHRWVVTGTPILNTLDELYSLVRFLEVDPWADSLWWNKVVTQPLLRSESRPYEFVRTLLKSIMLRRTKQSKDTRGRSLVSLPPLSVQTLYVFLSADERHLYNTLYSYSKAYLNLVFTEPNTRQKMPSIFEKILKLRQMCNHPQLAKQVRVLEQESLASLIEWTDTSPEYKEILAKQLVQELECPVCLQSSEKLRLTKCGHLLCKECADMLLKLQKHCPLCKAPLYHAFVSRVPTHNRFAAGEPLARSSKVEAIFGILEVAEPTVVFSQWVSTLDLLGHFLTEEGVSYSRIDGSLNKVQRDVQIAEFSQTNLLLATLKASCMGLNLVHATRVIIVEPWWNSAVELQAIQRVHRIGQSQTVTAIRLICAETIEEDMQRIQSNKEEMIEQAQTEHCYQGTIAAIRQMFGLST